MYPILTKQDLVTIHNDIINIAFFSFFFYNFIMQSGQKSIQDHTRQKKKIKSQALAREEKNIQDQSKPPAPNKN